MTGYYLAAGLFLLCVYWSAKVGSLRRVNKNLTSAVAKQMEDSREQLDRSREHLDEVRAAHISESKVSKETIDALNSKLLLEMTKSASYFALIERVIAQRDERWSMFLEHSSQHLNAQALLEKTIERQRGWIQRAIEALNEYRKVAGQLPVSTPAELSAPVDVSKSFGDSIAKMKQIATPIIDALEERDKIAATGKDDTRIHELDDSKTI